MIMAHTLPWLAPESRFKAKHSLDSDEEDERDEVEETRLGDEDLAAQEEGSTVSWGVIFWCSGS